MTIWAPVAAALGASLLTGGLGIGGIWLQQHRRDRSVAMQEKATAYHQFISRSLSFSIRAHAFRNVLQARSSLQEGADVDAALRLRAPIDIMELHDWLAKDFEPINDAWSKIQIVGTPEAIDASTQLLDASADLVDIAITPGAAQGEAASTINGTAWTQGQQDKLQDASSRVIKEREAFIRLVREELGKEAVTLPVEGAAQTPDSLET